MQSAHFGNQQAVSSNTKLEGNNEKAIEIEKSTKVVYGKKGLLNFIGNLFVFLKNKDLQRLNFYFTIRDILIEHFELNYQYNIQLA